VHSDKGDYEAAIKDCDPALLHSHVVIALTPRVSIPSVLCRAAVHFEKGDYEAAIKDCDAAVDKGRELRADYALIARALARKGTALVKLGRLEEAVGVYNKSLTEHRTADTLKKLNEAEKTLKVRLSFPLLSRTMRVSSGCCTR
jgi:stress-induced-phosphoprotein 1